MISKHKRHHKSLAINRALITRLLLTLGILYTNDLYSQNIQENTILWTVSQCIDGNVGTTEEVIEKIVTHRDAHIEWRDVNDSIKYTFIVLEVNGAWSDVKNSGNVLYEVESNGRQGTAEFIRQNETIYIKIILLTPAGNPDIFKLSISNILPL